MTPEATPAPRVGWRALVDLIAFYDAGANHPEVGAGMRACLREHLLRLRDTIDARLAALPEEGGEADDRSTVARQ